MTTTEHLPPDQEGRKALVGALIGVAGLIVFLVVVGVVTTMAFSNDDGGEHAALGLHPDEVAPQYEMSPLNLNVFLTDEGIEPEILWIPAGRRVRLLLQNRGELEHHFRIIGLDPYHLRWLRTPEVSIDEVDGMTPEQLAAYGLGDVAAMSDEAEIEHVLHHINPWFERNRDASPTGIKPIGTEVHGWVIRGTNDLMEFFALVPGEYVAEDVRFPEFTMRVIVFEPPGGWVG